MLGQNCEGKRERIIKTLPSEKPYQELLTSFPRINRLKNLSDLSFQDLAEV